jgi:hypothetical protein
VRVPQLAVLSATILATGIAVAPSSLAASTASVGSEAAVAPVAPAVVLVNQPVKSLCAGHKFSVGVWYQKISGGSRAYRISISGPKHVRFFYQAGMASAAHWQMWKVLAGRHGNYRIVYSGHKPGSTKWSKYTVTVSAKRCVK